MAIALVASWTAALGLALLAFALETAPRDRIEITIDPAHLVEERPGAYASRLDPKLPPWWRCFGDTLSSGRTSDLELFEDGVRLGPAQAPHQAISELGGGRYSHWHRRLIFSTSDGTDPRTNGRSYRAIVSVRPAAWIEMGALVLAVAGAGVGMRMAATSREGAIARWFPRLLFASTAVGLLVMWNTAIVLLAPSWVGVQTDTASYLGDYPMRTIGYPLFLRGVAFVFGDLRPLTLIQVNAVLVSLIVLAWVTARVLGRREESGARCAWGVASLLLLFMGTSTRIFETSLTVMADGLYTALVCAVAATLGMAARRPSWRCSLVGGLLVACAVLVRPVGLGLVPALLLPWWWHRAAPDARGRASWRRTGAVTVAPALLAVGVLLAAASLRNLTVHGFFGLSSMGPMSLVGHVAWMISPETVPSEPELARHLQERIAPLIAQRPHLDWPIGYYLHTSDEYNILLYQIVLPETRKWADAHVPPGGDAHAEHERLLRVLATSPLRHRPWDYAQHVAANIAGAVHWLGRGPALRPSIVQARASGIECLANLPQEHRALFTGWIRHPEVDHHWDRNMLWERLRHPINDHSRIYAGLAVGSTLLGIALLPWTGRRLADGSGRWERLVASPASRMLGALAVMAWSTVTLISLSATMIFRYVDSLDPLFSTAIVIAAVLLWRAIVHRPAAGEASGVPPAPAASSRAGA